MAKKTYSTFLARVYRVELYSKRIYVYYEWKKPGSTQWSKTDLNGKPYSWTVPNSANGNAGYDRLAEQLVDEELVIGDDYVTVDPAVEFEVTMVQEARKNYKDEYYWKYVKRLSPVPEPTIFEELFGDK